MSEQLPHPSDLSDAQWALIEPLVPQVKLGWRPAEYEGASQFFADTSERGSVKDCQALDLARV